MGNNKPPSPPHGALEQHLFVLINLTCIYDSVSHSLTHLALRLLARSITDSATTQCPPLTPASLLTSCSISRSSATLSLYLLSPFLVYGKCSTVLFHDKVFLGTTLKEPFSPPVDVIMESSSSLDHSRHWRQEESKVGRLAEKLLSRLTRRLRG